MNRVIVINSNSFGKGDELLGEKLMGAFLKKIWVRQDKPDAIIFYNSGVKLVAKGSTVLDALNGLYDLGVELLACGTCLDHFEIRDDIAVGRVSNMEEISSIMMEANSVITV
ncbi:MAG: sulfurtransferase-like selenium metabolism protein YedF [Vallitalea sp.]|jgi:selenium metabolism protein YedF|nr:sulfurtransferase-like selenium metabolism protein YedF [Vallitalea sp.]